MTCQVSWAIGTHVDTSKPCYQKAEFQVYGKHTTLAYFVCRNHALAAVVYPEVWAVKHVSKWAIMAAEGKAMIQQRSWAATFFWCAVVGLALGGIVGEVIWLLSR